MPNMNIVPKYEHRNVRGVPITSTRTTIPKQILGMPLTFDSKVRFVNRDIRCHFHSINNQCAKYEQPPSGI